MSPKSIALTVRRSAPVELLYQTLRRSHTLELPELGMRLEIATSDILVDCGANVGSVSSRFARTGAHVVAFEPNPHCYETLTNRFRFVKNVEIIHAGVMDRHCTLDLHVPKEAGRGWDTSVAGSFRPEQATSWDDQIDSYKVDCIDLYAWVMRHDSIKLMKLDIEGSEIEVLNSLIDTGAIERIDFLAVETHDDQVKSLVEPTNALRSRIEQSGLAFKINLDWP